MYEVIYRNTVTKEHAAFYGHSWKEIDERATKYFGDDIDNWIEWTCDYID